VAGETSIINIIHMGLFQKVALDDGHQEVTPRAYKDRALKCVSSGPERS